MRDIKIDFYGWNWSPQWPPGSSEDWLEVLSVPQFARKPWVRPTLKLSHTQYVDITHSHVHITTDHTHGNQSDGYYGFLQESRFGRRQQTQAGLRETASEENQWQSSTQRLGRHWSLLLGFTLETLAEREMFQHNVPNYGQCSESTHSSL